MLEVLTLQNFGCHKAKTLQLSPGVTILRGANERGKSTLLQAWMYNWFGSQMLPEAIDEYVTWGEKKRSLKTTTVFSVGGVQWTCTRGGSGAELCSGGQVLVTNHGPVTAKIEELFGIPKGKAAVTMSAAQDEIRGVLALGATAAAEYIEKMANFSQLDELLKQISGQLNTGTTKLLEDQLVETERELANELATAPMLDLVGEEQALMDFSEGIREFEEELQELKIAIALETEKLRVSKAAVAKAVAALAAAKKARVTKAVLEASVVAAAGADDRIREIEDQSLRAQTYAVYQSMQSVSVPPTTGVWDGDELSLQHEVALAHTEAQSIRDSIRAVAVQVSERKSQRLVSPVCPYTKADCSHLSDPKVVAETNARIDNDIASMLQEQQGLRKRLELRETDIVAYEGITRAQKLVAAWVEQHPGLAAVDKGQVPWGLAWKPPVPPPAEYPKESTGAYVALLAAADRASAQLETLLVPSDEEVAALTVEAEGRVEPESLLPTLQTRISGIEATLEGKRQELSRRTRELEESRSKADNHKIKVELLQRRVAEGKQAVETTAQDNEFMKALRSARLLVTDLLWVKLLRLTTFYFSKMRGGEESQVTRGANGGFLIDGSSVVSGSTMDLLGLALRIAVAKLFSNCPVLLLDEANRGADPQRSTSMFATLAGAGFDQIVAVTHKDTDESACDQLIEV